MTRKQALELAIQALSDTGQTEAAGILHTLSKELPLTRWTEDAIRDSVEQFILDHGRVPTVTDFKKRGLPPHTVIKGHYGMTLKAWLAQSYPTEMPPLSELQAQATENFIREHLRIRPVSAEDYNARRGFRSRGWYTIAKYNHTRRWRILLEKLNLPIYNNRGTPMPKPQFDVHIFSDIDFRD